jgi:hypothetical protein
MNSEDQIDLVKKEFYLFKQNIDDINRIRREKQNDEDNNIIPRFIMEDCVKNNTVLMLRSYQIFVQNFINPNTPYNSLLLKWETGMGKTIGALSIALNFINALYKERLYNNSAMGSVFIVGFTQQIFINELLRFPEFGFINEEETKYYRNLKSRINSGRKDDIDELRNFEMKLRKRLRNRTGNGFFVFYGYKELTNKIFLQRDDSLKIYEMSEKEITAALEEEKLEINYELLKEFDNSLIICDEIHNVYNTLEKNNWGATLQVIFNYNKNVKKLLLSATPINNSPTEVIDLLNLLLPKFRYDELKKEDFFNGEKIKNDESLKAISSLLQGRVSYIRNSNVENFAKKELLGECLPGCRENIRFMRSPMSSFHYKTYKQDRLPDSYIDDFALPDPRYKDPYKCKGIHRSDDIKTLLTEASTAWKNKHGLSYSTNEDMIRGSAFSLNNDLSKISSKYHLMIKRVLSSIKSQSGKIFIYHNNIHMSGTFTIKEVLEQNGIISETGMSSSNTICSICGRYKKEHVITTGGSKEDVAFIHERDRTNKIILVDKEYAPVYDEEIKSLTHNCMELDDHLVFYKDSEEDAKHKVNRFLASSVSGGKESSHDFTPARYIIVHSKISKKQILMSMDRFNAVNNVYGHKFMVLIGSKIIKESYSMKGVRRLMVMSRPDNISTLIQIIGRTIRFGSHSMLEQKDRTVKIELHTHCLPEKDGRGRYLLSHEENRYMEKIKIHKEIKKIENIMHINAIDKFINYNYIWGEKNQNTFFDIMPYEFNDKKFTLRELESSSFNALYADQEVNYLIYVIKRLFVEISREWKYKDLLHYVKNPPFNVEIDASLIEKKHVDIALTKLLYSDNNHSISSKKNSMMSYLLNPQEKRVFINGVEHAITQMGEFYMLASLNSLQELDIDVDSTFRSFSKKDIKCIDIKRFLKEDSEENFDNRKYRFIKNWEKVSFNNMKYVMSESGVTFHQDLLEDSIAYLSRLWTGKINKKNEFSDFYVKFMHVYDLQNFVIWVDTILDKDIYKRYVGYTTKKKLKEKEVEKEDNDNLINYLISSLNKSNEKWIDTDFANKVNAYTNKVNSLTDGVYVRKNNIKPLECELPVGHLLCNNPRYYDIEKDSWYTSSLQQQKYKENDVIIGYDERIPNSINTRFKIRTPSHSIKRYKDNRLVEKGSVCNTKSKPFLIDLSSKLGINVTNANINEMCTSIRKRLITLEIEERKKMSNIKYFYFLY